MIKYLANILTISRIVCSLILIGCTTFGALFWLFYVWCGLSDMADGVVARKTGSVTKRGAQLDSLADIVFFIVCFMKILPELSIPVWLWIWVALIALIKISNYLCGYIKYHRLIMPHTIANKATGALLFLLPIVIQYVPLTIPAIIICILATFAAVEENYLCWQNIYDFK